MSRRSKYKLLGIFSRTGKFLLLLLSCFVYLGKGGYLGLASASAITEENITELTNSERATFDLRQLTHNEKLARAAERKAEDMLEKDYWSHFGPNGEKPWTFILNEGYDYVYAGENLAKGFATSQGIIDAWMNSKTHRENILNPEFDEIGVAVTRGFLEDEEVILVVQMFGSLKPGEKYAEEDNNPDTVPEIALESPHEGETIGASPIQITARTKGASQLYFYLDQQEIGSQTVENNKIDFEYMHSLSDGIHRLTASVTKLTDLQNINTTQSGIAERTFTVDTTPPEITDVAMSVGKDIGAGSVRISLRAQDAERVVLATLDKRTVLSKESDRFVVILSSSELREIIDPGATVIAADSAKNTTELDITDQLAQFKNESSVTKGFWIVSSTLSSVLGKNTVIPLSVAAIFFLLVDVYLLYVQRKLPREKGHGMLALGIFLVILMIGIGADTGTVL